MANPRRFVLPSVGVVAFAIVALLASAPPHPVRAAGAAATPEPLASPEKLLQRIRLQFRSHRPPPPYVTYTIIRKQNTAEGFPDYSESYTEHVWCRTSDRAALARRVYRDENRGPLMFERPAFNEPRDPGPPTADLFERAPVVQHANPQDFVPTPEPSGTPIENIASVVTHAEFSYKVTAVKVEGDLLHLSVQPYRDVERNRLREIYVDRKTYEIRRVVATDRLYIEGGPSYGVIFTIDLQMLQGRPVITHVHGEVGDGYNGDGQQIEYYFNDIRFPSSLPDWYFDPRDYAAHADDAPI